MKKKLFTFIILVFSFNAMIIAQTHTDSLAKKNDSQELSLKLSNPVAKMISVPFQFNVTQGVGPFNGSQFLMNFQPVIPFTLGKINVITRTIIPFIENRNVMSDRSTQSGLSDINFSVFLSPTKVGKFIYGIGPSLSLPTASKNYLGSEKWAIGPSVVVLKQIKGLTALVLVRQIWSVAGNENRDDINLFFINPGFGYAFKSGAGLGANVEYTTSWNKANSSQLYLNFSGSMVSKFGELPVSFSIGPKIPLTSETPGDWGLKAGFTLIFAK